MRRRGLLMRGSIGPGRSDRPARMAAPTASARRLGQGLEFLAAPLAARHSHAGSLPDTIFTAVEPDSRNDTTGDFSFVSTVRGSTFQWDLDTAGFNDGDEPIETPSHSGPMLATRSR